jgi:DNA-directed RNA polymerase specialized sigma subunit
MSLPAQINELTNSAYCTLAGLVHSLGRMPTVEEFAAELQVDKGTAELVLKNLPQTFSLDDEIS